MKDKISPGWITTMPCIAAYRPISYQQHDWFLAVPR